jgi:protein-S-isoprenylcysteine O-methyltransferase Ste14
MSLEPSSSPAVTPSLAAPSLAARYKYFAANLLVLWLFILFYRTNHYYLGFLSARTQVALLWLASAYSILGLVWYSLYSAARPSRAFVAIGALWRWLRQTRAFLRAFPDEPTMQPAAVSHSEKTALLFLLIKFIYLPMMIEFFIGNWFDLRGKIWLMRGVSPLFNLRCLNLVFYPLFIDLFFITECAFYAFGYAVESPRLKNVVKSVEPTVLGWVVALACYPPGNGFINNWAAWYTSDSPDFQSEGWSLFFKCLVLACFTVYLWGAISLGFKCSNLTNRGIVQTGAFKYVRHPAYIAKNVAWWLCLVPVLVSCPRLTDALAPVLSMAFWSFLYFMRAITEERHLLRDPQYQEYCKQVPYRFIPGVI